MTRVEEMQQAYHDAMRVGNGVRALEYIDHLETVADMEGLDFASIDPRPIRTYAVNFLHPDGLDEMVLRVDARNTSQAFERVRGFVPGAVQLSASITTEPGEALR